MSVAAAQQQKMVIQVIKTPEVMGKGCFPPGGTSPRSSIKEGMAQEASWSFTVLLSWVAWPEDSAEERAEHPHNVPGWFQAHLLQSAA